MEVIAVKGIEDEEELDCVASSHCGAGHLLSDEHSGPARRRRRVLDSGGHPVAVDLAEAVVVPWFGLLWRLLEHG
jgi:hypothetical protein